jgi:hypothetical protein
MTIDRKRLTKPTERSPVERFKGKTRKGTPNKVTVLFKEALLMAPHLLGQDGKGKDGVVGWLKQQAIDYPETYLKMLVRFFTPTEVQMLALTMNQQNNIGQAGDDYMARPEMQQAARLEAFQTTFRGLIKGKSSKDLKLMLATAQQALEQSGFNVDAGGGRIVRLDRTEPKRIEHDQAPRTIEGKAVETD